MIPRSIELFIDALKDYGVDLDPVQVHQDPGGFLFALLKGMFYIVELLEDQYSQTIDYLKTGGIIDELGS